MKWLQWQIERRINRFAFGGSFFEEGDGWIAVATIFFCIAVLMSYCSVVEC